MKKYIKKPVVVDAILYDGTNYEDIKTVMLPFVNLLPVLYLDGKIGIYTLEGEMKADVGDYIIKGIKNEFYPCKPDIFEETYTVCMDYKSYPKLNVINLECLYSVNKENLMEEYYYQDKDFKYIDWYELEERLKLGF